VPDRYRRAGWLAGPGGAFDGKLRQMIHALSRSQALECFKCSFFALFDPAHRSFGQTFNRRLLQPLRQRRNRAIAAPYRPSCTPLCGSVTPNELSSFLSRPGPPWSIALRDRVGGGWRLLARRVETPAAQFIRQGGLINDSSKPGPSVVCMRKAASTISLAMAFPVIAALYGFSPNLS